MGTPRSTPEDSYPNDALDGIRQTMRQLVWPGGCAWHAAQNHDSLIPFLVEETAEFIDAIDRRLGPEEVASELGDVLYQVLFHAAIAERDDEGYDFDTVTQALNEKLIARHPHVFGDRGYMSVEELNAEWERLKEDAAGERRGSRGVLDGIPRDMPTLARAAKVVERLKRARLLDPENAASIITSASTTKGAVPTSGAVAEDHADPSTEIGDELLAVVVRANAVGVDADRALRLAIARLVERHVEE
ncbi:MazG nucleotide pyrophosphohydrolase domain-containing protein [Leucobacter sp. W1478]|uniref:MazG nucleotide pyrophosphohydrolase domain-containing protein n=1 Tax=Leucobacter sp. W1478 TaxID=3439065 RepID=UPI003F2E5382